jgi:hypothetical protein
MLGKMYEQSNLFQPIRKEVAEWTNGYVTKGKYYLADVEAFVEPLVVVADIGGKRNDFFVLKSRQKWRQNFIDWLESEIEDEISDSEDENESNAEENWEEEDDTSGEEEVILENEETKEDSE